MGELSGQGPQRIQEAKTTATTGKEMVRVTWEEQRRCSQKDNAWKILKVLKKPPGERAPWGARQPRSKKGKKKKTKRGSKYAFLSRNYPGGSYAP